MKRLETRQEFIDRAWKVLDVQPQDWHEHQARSQRSMLYLEFAKLMPESDS